MLDGNNAKCVNNIGYAVAQDGQFEGPTRTADWPDSHKRFVAHQEAPTRPS